MLPDQLSKEIYYVLISTGIFVQNLGGPTKLVYGQDGEYSSILTTKPTWISKSNFPIQLAGDKKYSFNSLMAISKETELEFKILHVDRRTHFDYTKFKKLHQKTLTSINLENLYGSFTKLFENNYSVRIISVAGLISAIIVLCLIIIICIYCCSRSQSGSRRYQKYSHRHGAAVITRREDAQPPPSAPDIESSEERRPRIRRARDGSDNNRDRLQRLLNKL